MTKTAHIASQWFPTASAERLKPVCRLMLWTLYNDDRCEECNLQELYHVRDQSLEILRGTATRNDVEIPLAGLLFSLREELVQFLPEESMSRFINGLQKYLMVFNRSFIIRHGKSFLQ